uniref:G_PROTEIN_RECEP_F1_2 domain-containing protein n=1 Tax=Caenorhabditis tropicalis TaxID=1561998 RepID=A0A1I7UBB4_9PELO
MENSSSNIPNFQKFAVLESNRSIQQPFMDVIIWLFLFAFTVLTMFLLLIVRLRVIARRDSFFNFPLWFYIVFIISLALYIIIPMPFCWITSVTTPSEIQNFLYVLLCQIILYEIHQQCKVWSEKVLKYHRKVLKDTIIQNIILGIFLGVTPIIQILIAYGDPEADMTILSIITNVIFVSSPIPYSITILYQNTAYRRFIISMFRFRDQQKAGRVGSTIQVSVAQNNMASLRNSPKNSPKASPKSSKGSNK